MRQKYRTKDPAFLSRKEEDLQLGRYPCGNFESHPYGKVRRAYGKVRRDYQIGDAVLYVPRKGDLLEPGSWRALTMPG